MGRGLGKVQKQILEILKEDQHEWIQMSSLMMKLFGTDDDWDLRYRASEAFRQSIYRALRTLEKRGIIESRIRQQGHPPEGMTDREALSGDPEIDSLTITLWEFLRKTKKFWKEVRLSV